MKKKLEADLISIAHRILKLKNKSDINQLYLETQKLYEKLAILKFVDENFDTVKPTINHSEISTEIAAIFDTEETAVAVIPANEPVVTEEIAPVAAFSEPEPVVEIKEETIIATPVEIIREDKIEEPVQEAAPIEIPATIFSEPLTETIPTPVAEIEVHTSEEAPEEVKEETKIADELSFRTTNDLKPIPDFKPAFELTTEEIEVVETPKTETQSKKEPLSFSLEDILGIKGNNYVDPQFIKVESFENVSTTPTPAINEFEKKKTEVETAVTEPVKPKTVPLNEKLAKGFHIDLNDRIAFTKNLFANSTEDYSRVLNQLLTFDNYQEAKDFIEDMVKPDYNNWEGKDDYAERFLGIVEKKFS